jgi:hypothetical protein
MEVHESEIPLHYFCSHIGLVPKMVDGVQTDWRVIFDLSSPLGSSVNDGIPKEYGSLIYETLNDAIQLVAQVGKGAVIMKRDLKAAFRHIPINLCDYWLFVFEWDGKYYVDMFLPFGLRTACISSICSQRRCIGSSTRYTSGTVPITLTTSSLSSPLLPRFPKSQLNSTRFSMNSDFQRHLKKISTEASSFISALNLNRI